MKKLLSILILSLLFNLTGHAQDYEPFIKDGSFWDVETYDPAGFCNYDLRKYQIASDTLINGLTYKKVKILPFHGDPHPDWPDFCIIPPYEIYGNDFSYAEFYLRENIANQKVYIWTRNFVNTNEFKEYTLYDFDVETGDEIENSYHAWGASMTVINVEVNTDGRKVVTVGGPINDYTEGIGTETGIFNNDHPIGGPIHQLICWGNSSNQNGCTPVLSINNYRLQQIKIFPNPTADKLSFTNLENNTFKLYSILGKEMSFQFSQENQEIDISHLQQGIYFLEIRGTQNSKRVVKVIKN